MASRSSSSHLLLSLLWQSRRLWTDPTRSGRVPIILSLEHEYVFQSPAARPRGRLTWSEHLLLRAGARALVALRTLSDIHTQSFVLLTYYSSLPAQR